MYVYWYNTLIQVLLDDETQIFTQNCLSDTIMLKLWILSTLLWSTEKLKMSALRHWSVFKLVCRLPLQAVLGLFRPSGFEKYDETYSFLWQKGLLEKKFPRITNKSYYSKTYSERRQRRCKNFARGIDDFFKGRCAIWLTLASCHQEALRLMWYSTNLCKYFTTDGKFQRGRAARAPSNISKLLSSREMETLHTATWEDARLPMFCRIFLLKDVSIEWKKD